MYTHIKYFASSKNFFFKKNRQSSQSVQNRRKFAGQIQTKRLENILIRRYITLNLMYLSLS